MALYRKISLMGLVMMSETTAEDNFIRNTLRQQQTISLAQKLAGVSDELNSDIFGDKTTGFQSALAAGLTTNSLTDLAISNNEKKDEQNKEQVTKDANPNDALKQVQQGSDDLMKAVEADKKDSQSKMADAQKQINQWSQSMPATDAPSSAVQSIQDPKATTTDEQAASAIKSYEVSIPKSSQSNAQSKGKTEKEIVDAAMNSPMPLGLDDQLKEQNKEVEMHLGEKEKGEVQAAAQTTPAKDNSTLSNIATAVSGDASNAFQSSANVSTDIASAINSLQEQRFESKAHDAVLKKIGDSFETGKSLSITDVVDVGGEFQKKLNEMKQSEMSAEDKEKQAKAKEDADNGITDNKASGFRVDLTNEDGAGYVGTIYMGSEQTPIKVLFDTGSDFLAITSDLCLNATLGKQELAEAVFDPVTLTYKNSGKDLRKCKSTAYLSQQSTSAKQIGGDDEHLDYGSAKLTGKMFTDMACIDQNKTSCANFEFLALYQAVGLDDTDGVLGLAVHPDAKRRNLNYVWNLKNNGLIDRAMVSFSIAGPAMDDQSYATFGGMNPEQIVGGTAGLHKMSTTAYRPYWSQSVKQWALEGKEMKYGYELAAAPGGEKSYTAIIDTGSSNIGIPEEMFKSLKEKWSKDVHDLDCVTDDNFCQVMTPCADIAKKLKPVSFSIGGQTFEMGPALYLHQAEGTRCQFAIHSNQLKGTTGNLVLVGDTLLRHLYQVYDFENETIALGVNTHSQDKIIMYDDGKRPENAPFIQQEEDMHFAS